MQGVTVNGYRRLAKPTAKRLYNSGKTIYIVPCALRPGGAWKPEIAISKADRSEDAAYFVSTANDFEIGRASCSLRTTTAAMRQVGIPPTTSRQIDQK